MTRVCIHSICVAIAVFLVGSGRAEAATHIVTITATQDFGTLNIAFGDTVIWRTTTGVSHNAIACAGVGANPTREQVTACSTSGGRFATATVASPGGTVEVGRVTFSLGGDGGSSYPYKCTIHASSMHGKIIVAPEPMPEIDVLPSVIARTITQGQNPSNQNITISNSGVGTAFYSLTDNAAWLSLSACVAPSICSVSSETDTIVVQYAAGALAAGPYSATVTITSSNASNSPQEISVNLTVNEFSLDQVGIVANDGQVGDEFGFSTAISGDTLVIGARGDDDVAGSAGSVYVYRRSGASFVFEQKLTAASVGTLGLLGHSVSIDGDTLLAGSFNVGNGVGHAYAFVRNDSTWTLQEEFLTEPGPTFTGFGSSVSVEGDLAAIGAPFDDQFGDNAGAVYFFRRSGTNWVLEQKLAAANPVASGEFGASVAMSDGRVVIGSPGIGSVYVYVRLFVSRIFAFRWFLQDEIIIGVGRLGQAVDMDGDRFVVGFGSLGLAYVYAFDGALWNLEDAIVPLLPDATSTDFGGSVAIDGAQILLGDVGADFNEAGSGAAFLFERDGSEWLQRLNIGDSGGQSNDGFGNGVALQGDSLIAGADNESSEGAVFVFEPPLIFEITSGPDGTPNPVASGGMVSLSVGGEDSFGNPASSFNWRAACSPPLEPTACSHDLCSLGTPLDSACDPCVAQVCGVDPFCCTNAWDQLCIRRVATECGSALCNGLFSDTSIATPAWTAPSVQDPNPRTCQITVTAGNGIDRFETASFSQTVQPIPEAGRSLGMLVALLSIAGLGFRSSRRGRDRTARRLHGR
jgi:plastocyanin